MVLNPARLAAGPDGTPYSEAYGDVYHSTGGGPQQARHVFLGGNDLPRRWHDRDRFVILETGFGLGLNFLATWAAWTDDPRRCRRLHFISVEKHPFSRDDLAAAQSAWPEFAVPGAELRRLWPPLLPGMHRLEFAGGGVILTLIFGDATDRLRLLHAAVDAFYLDGFSPARNPELWDTPLLRTLSRLAAPGATLATWSVAGRLRAALSDAEFDVEKRPGFAGKRHMLAARYRSRKPHRQSAPAERTAILIGAGLAGCMVAERLAARGWSIEIFDECPDAAGGASSNHAGILRPHPSIDDNPLSRLTRAGFLATRAFLQEACDTARWQDCGVLYIARDSAHEALLQRAVKNLAFPGEFLAFADRNAASAIAQCPLPRGGWWFGSSGWAQPRALCTTALARHAPRITTHFGQPVAQLRLREGRWQALSDSSTTLASASAVIVAAGAQSRRFDQLSILPLRPARGQTTHLDARLTPRIERVICGKGYVTPAIDGIHVAGATFQVDDEDLSPRIADHIENLRHLKDLLPDLATKCDPASTTGRVGLRSITPDRLPVVGPLPGQPGLYCATGYGPRGLVWCVLMAELLACQMEGEPLPLESNLVRMVAPARFSRPARK